MADILHFAPSTVAYNPVSLLQDSSAQSTRMSQAYLGWLLWLEMSDLTAAFLKQLSAYWDVLVLLQGNCYVFFLFVLPHTCSLLMILLHIHFLFFNKACTSWSNILSVSFGGINAFNITSSREVTVSHVVPTHSCRKPGCCWCCNNPQRWLFYIVLFFSCIASLGYCQRQYLLFLLLCATVVVRGFGLDSDSLSGMKRKWNLS